MKTISLPKTLVLLTLAACGATTPPPDEYPPAPASSAAGAERGAEPSTGDTGADTTSYSLTDELTGVSRPVSLDQLPAAIRMAIEGERNAPVVVAGDHTIIEGGTPSMRVTALRGRDKGKFRVTLTNWSLAADPGNHVHVIVDNEPYIAVRDVSAPLDIAALVRDNLHHELTPGRHVVRMFPSRPHHESVKVEGNFFVAEFENGRGESNVRVDARAPMLTYSRPKGCYASGSRVLVDFYLSNVPNFGTHHRVAVSVDGTDIGEISEWRPYFLENLPVGEHDVRLRLMDGGGLMVPDGMRATDAVAGSFNDTTRRITIAETCGGGAPASPHGQH
jgi:hypothetical protein